MHETRIIMHTSIILRFSSIWNEKFGQKVQFWNSTFPLVIKFKLRNMRRRTFTISAWKVIDNPTHNSHIIIIMFFLILGKNTSKYKDFEKVK